MQFTKAGKSSGTEMKNNSETWYLYILLCNNNSLYTGITNDLEKRMQVHASGKGAKYVNAHKPFTKIYHEELPDKSSALKREAEIKSWPRADKILRLKLEVPDVVLKAKKLGAK